MSATRKVSPRASGPTPALVLSICLARSLREQSRAHRKALRKCREHCSPKAVHALRIAARRLLAGLDVVRALVPDPALDKVRRKLKRELRATGALRDAHVQARLFERTLPAGTRTSLAAFEKHLCKRERRLTRKTRNALASGNRPHQLARVARRLRKQPATASDETRHRAAAGRALRQSFARIMTRHRTTQADPAALHRLRIALKQGRYVVELLAPFFPAINARQRERLRACQSAMGDVHDLDLFLVRLEKFTAKGKLKPRPTKSAAAVLRRRRRKLVRTQQRLTDSLLRHDWKRLLAPMLPRPKPR